MKNDTLHLRTDYRFSAGDSHDLELSYLFGWARMTRENVIDQDTGLALDPILRALPDPPLPATYDEERRTAESEFVSVQHEIQLKPLTEGPLEWIVGTFFYREDNSARVDFDIMDDRGSIPGVVDDGDVRYAQSFIQPNRSLAAWPTMCGACASTGASRSVVSVAGATRISRGRPSSSHISTAKV